MLRFFRGCSLRARRLGQLRAMRHIRLLLLLYKTTERFEELGKLRCGEKWKSSAARAATPEEFALSTADPVGCAPPIFPTTAPPAASASIYIRFGARRPKLFSPPLLLSLPPCADERRHLGLARAAPGLGFHSERSPPACARSIPRPRQLKGSATPMSPTK